MSEPEKTRMQLWRENPEKVTWAAKLFKSPNWKELLDIMQEGEHVRLYDIPANVSADKQLGRIEGWDLFPGRLRLAGIPLVPPKDLPPPTFAPVEEPQD